MAKSEDRFLVRASQDVTLDGEIWGAEVHASDGGVKTYGIAGADGQAEAARKEAETAREAAETKRAEDEAARTQAETARAAAELERAAQQVKNNSDQAANNASAQGLQVVKLNQGQYDPSTLMPTVQGEVGKLYFVPIPSQAMSALAALVDVPAGDGQDDYLEWMSIDGKWERVGMSNATLVSLTTDEIDRIAAGEQVTSESVLGGTGLTYLWAKLKTAFAAFAHKHVTGDVTGLDTALGDKATKAELKTVQDSLGHSLLASMAAGASKTETDGLYIDVLNVDGSANGPCILGTEDASKLANCPVKSGAFYAYRLVFPVKSEHNAYCHYLVMLFEFLPSTGRIWAAGYNNDAKNWTQDWIAVTRG